ncbi:hypothetical protein AMIS_19300 [Actinoplanes missouriensis 431]|uniref:DUF3068 domain-containing protein n=1 Tax=Actinoplanes missouriensis (strain ATCC 14538 / DSM 43046 / CBS 188.64 / JCM 3121 / NBRC 102363 / NCIMB 12654 / NRRL B-3342 / UNCC 431) TaxID=512565 RepID=I0H2B3_ACTM4|nr:DUF3068 domain-containing protein [Actinoplanes missouriensis]BAL87150.1 hypothetical protein AMIS_19300 [Actinoplanes missouriensis 431]
MTRRLTGVTLFGLGVLCLLLAGGLAWIIVPSQKKVPLDLIPPDVVVADDSATFAQAKDGQVTVEQAGLRSRTGITPDFRAAADLTGDLADETLIWNVFHATDRADTGEAINRAESRVALDRRSGAAVDWEGQCHSENPGVACLAGNVDFEGQLYLFPFGTEKKTYQYWDSALHRALPMEYTAEENFNGLPTYRFEQQIPQQAVDMDPTSLAGLMAFLAPGATTGTVNYRAARTLWVEPKTGAIVGYREQQHRELVPDSGAPIVIFDADLQYDQDTLAALHDQAAGGRTQLMLLGFWVPIILVLIGLALMIGGFLLTRGAPGTGRRTPAHAAEPEPAPAQRTP